MSEKQKLFGFLLAGLVVIGFAAIYHLNQPKESPWEEPDMPMSPMPLTDRTGRVPSGTKESASPKDIPSTPDGVVDDILADTTDESVLDAEAIEMEKLSEEEMQQIDDMQAGYFVE